MTALICFADADDAVRIPLATHGAFGRIARYPDFFMARDQIDMTPLQSRDELVAWFEAGIKPPSRFRIGTEHEKTPFTLDGRQPVPYEGARGIGALLEGMQLLLGWEPIMERGNIIGLTTSPAAARFRWSPAASSNCRARRSKRAPDPGRADGASGAGARDRNAAGDRLPRPRHDAVLVAVADPGDAQGPLQDHDQLHAEGRPVRHRHDVPDLHGADQSRLLLRSRHGQEAARVDRAAAGGDRLFANSPFTEGKPNGFLSFRSEIWRDTDNARSGMLPWVFEDGMGFERWVDYALDVPMYFVKRGETYIDVAGSSFRAFFEGRNNSLPGERPTLSDWANHLSTIFPEVRLKRYLEMRGADGVPWGRLPALPAFWVGLLYDDESLNAAWDLVSHWTAQERQALRDDVPRFGFKARIRDRYLFEIALGVPEAVACRLAAAWPHRSTRPRREPPPRTAGAHPRTGRTPAEEMLDKFNGEWGGSVEPAYQEYAF